MVDLELRFTIYHLNVLHSGKYLLLNGQPSVSPSRGVRTSEDRFFVDLDDRPDLSELELWEWLRGWWLLVLGSSSLVSLPEELSWSTSVFSTLG